MTRQKSFKRRVRDRAEKTGESYTSARRRLIAKSDRPVDGPEGAIATGGEGAGSAPSLQPVETVAEGERRVSVEALRDRTGRTWDEWFTVLDEWGAAEREHREIARWLVDEHGVGGWWAQSVTVAYEQARGRRVPGQRSDGYIAAGASKTIAVPVERLFDAFEDEDERRRWLADAELRLRTSSPGKSLRFDWGDGSTRVAVYLDAKGDSKSQVAVQHERLRDAGEAEGLKAFWRERLSVLKETLER